MDIYDNSLNHHSLSYDIESGNNYPLQFFPDFTNNINDEINNIYVNNNTSTTKLYDSISNTKYSYFITESSSLYSVENSVLNYLIDYAKYNKFVEYRFLFDSEFRKKYYIFHNSNKIDDIADAYKLQKSQNGDIYVMTTNHEIYKLNA